jgi:hypothetical protein
MLSNAHQFFMPLIIQSFLKNHHRFLKLVSILDLPLLRITACGSKDGTSVSEYYSSALVRFVRSVLEIIPQSMFRILNEIIQLMTGQLKPIPMKLERQYLKDFSQLDLRHTLARATHQVSVFSEGILMMNTTLYGVIEVDPKQMYAIRMGWNGGRGGAACCVLSVNNVCAVCSCVFVPSILSKRFPGFSCEVSCACVARVYVCVA